MPSSFSHFATTLCRKFERGRFLIVGVDPQKVGTKFAQAGREAVVTESHAEFLSRSRMFVAEARFEVAVWFYPSDRSADSDVAEAVSRCADQVVLIPARGANIAQRRPQLVESFRRFWLLPDYGYEVAEIDPEALLLRRLPKGTADEAVPGMETAVARMNMRLGRLQQNLQTTASELKAAHAHIAALEEKLLKVKEYRRELKRLKEQREQLRRSPERRLGQALLAPYRVPEKLLKRIWKRLLQGTEPRSKSPRTEYQKWFERHRTHADDLRRMRNEARSFSLQPLISVITPVFDTSVRWLEEAVDSMLAQAYENWELLLIDDGSSAPDLLKGMSTLAARDQRITLVRAGEHKGISAASNHGISLAHGEWIAFLDHDDVLEPDALFQIAKFLQTHPDADLIYSDEDKLGEEGLEAPVLKPDWSPDLFSSHNYIGHFTAARRDIVEKAGGFRSEFDSAQDYDLFFRVIEQTNRIHHIPRVLYHWRRSADSSAMSVRQKPGQLEASRRAIEEHLKRRGEKAHVSIDWRTHAFCIRRELSEAKKISIIVRNEYDADKFAQHIERLTAHITYPNYEIVVVQRQDEYFPRTQHRVVRTPAAISVVTAGNLAGGATDAAWLLFLDAGAMPIESDWLTIMAEHVQRPEVGVVGAQLLNPDGTVDHAGIVLGVNGIGQPAFRGLPSDNSTTHRGLHITRNCSAVSGACMLTSREVFEEVGGFDESLPEGFADVDLCLKMRRAGYLIVYTPFAKLHWNRPQSDNIDMNAEVIMRGRWCDVLERDPYYNPNLSRERADFSLGK